MRDINRFLTRDLAAKRLGISRTTFNRLVTKGVIPAGIGKLGLPKWDMYALDAMMTGGSIPASPEDAVHAIAAEIRARAKDRPQAPGRRNNQGIPIRARAG